MNLHFNHTFFNCLLLGNTDYISIINYTTVLTDSVANLVTNKHRFHILTVDLYIFSSFIPYTTLNSSKRGHSSLKFTVSSTTGCPSPSGWCHRKSIYEKHLIPPLQPFLNLLSLISLVVFCSRCDEWSGFGRPV